MTPFLWSHIAHNMAKARLQAVSRLKEPSMRVLQNTSSDDATRQATPAARHASCTIGHVKNKWGQSSSSPAHSGQHTTSPGNMRGRMTLVIRRRRKSSQPKIQIFTEDTHSTHSVTLIMLSMTFIKFSVDWLLISLHMTHMSSLLSLENYTNYTESHPTSSPKAT